MRAETVDCVMFILRAASMKLPVSATIRNVRARLTSIVHLRSKLQVTIYLSKFPIVVTGKFRLWMDLILTTLVSVPIESDLIRLIFCSGSQRKDDAP